VRRSELSATFQKINHLLITGNGFDLALGLPTSYSDFMQAVSAAIKFSDGQVNLKDVFPEKFTPENPSALDKHYALQASYDLSEIKNQANNAWLQYFLWLNTQNSISNTEKKWVDFEREIHQLLDDVAHLKLEIDRFESETKSEFNLTVWRSKPSSTAGVQIRGASFARLSKALQWRPTQIGSDGLVASLKDQKYQTPTAIIFYLYEELKTFAILFKTYLNNLVVPIFKEKKFEKLAIDATPETTGIITFNYTPIAELLKFQCHYLHGNIDADIIFGIDSAEGLLEQLDSGVLSFTKYFQSIFHRTFAANFKQAKFHSKNHNHYYFYGHSFDLSDRSYIKVIFDSVSASISQKITTYYHTEESRASILRNLLDPRMLGDDAQEKIERLIAEGRLSFIEKTSLLPQS
jgi:Bacteriophage abortive infection AbiH